MIQAISFKGKVTTSSSPEATTYRTSYKQDIEKFERIIGLPSEGISDVIQLNDRLTIKYTNGTVVDTRSDRISLSTKAKTGKNATNPLEWSFRLPEKATEEASALFRKSVRHLCDLAINYGKRRV